MNPLDAGAAIFGAGRVPIDGILRLGHKGPTGAPTDREFLEVASADLVARDAAKRGGGTFKVEEHPRHPAAGAYNDRPKERRTTFAARIEGRVGDLFAFGRSLRNAPPGKAAPPAGGSWCSTGRDHATAMRWDGTAHTALACPGERCQYAADDQPPERRCKATSSVILTAAEPGIPPLRLRLRSGGWATGRAILGLAQTLAAGGSEVVSASLTVVVSVAKNARTKSAYPVVAIRDLVIGAAPQATPESAPDPESPPATAAAVEARTRWAGRAVSRLVEYGYDEAAALAAVADCPDMAAAKTIIDAARADAERIAALNTPTTTGNHAEEADHDADY
jgi:hypothetical protein